MKKLNEITLKCKKTNFNSTKIESSTDAYKCIKSFYNDDINLFESMFILLLNQQNKTIGFAKLSQGGIESTIFDAKIAVKYICDSLATGVIIAHNHPSGNTKPSRDDEKITNTMKEICKIIGCRFLDHLIISEEMFYSFADENFIV